MKKALALAALMLLTTAGAASRDAVGQVTNGPDGIDASLRMEWRKVGKIELDGRRLRFPEVPKAAGLYRFDLVPPNLSPWRYVGQAENLSKRLQQYRTPGRRQDTSRRVSSQIRHVLGIGGSVEMAVATGEAAVCRKGHCEQADFSDVKQRMLFERLGILFACSGTVVCLNLDLPTPARDDSDRRSDHKR